MLQLGLKNPAQSGISGQDQDTIRLCRKSLRDAVAQLFHAVSTLARQTDREIDKAVQITGWRFRAVQ